MFKISFGRVNLPHKGHKKLIESVDLFILSAKSSKNKLPDNVRYSNLIKMFPSLKNKIKVGNIKEYLCDLSGDNSIIVKCGKENLRLPKYYGFKTETAERVESSTRVRSLIERNNNLELLNSYDWKLDRILLAKEIYKYEKDYYRNV